MSKISPGTSPKKTTLEVVRAVVVGLLVDLLGLWRYILPSRVRIGRRSAAWLSVAVIFLGTSLVYRARHAPLSSSSRGPSTAHSQSSSSHKPASHQNAAPTKQPQSATNKPTPSSNPPEKSPNAACSLLTQTAAQQILGAQVTLALADTQGSTSDVAVSTCTYTNGAAEPADREGTSLVAHIALTSLGISENDVVFGSAKPSDATDITGYGQAAYWNPETAELNILAHNNWYTISRDKGTPPVRSDVSAVEAVAHALAAEF
jgi:hypothetical protein